MNLYLQLLGLLFITLLFIIYITKSKKNKINSKLFKRLIIINLIGEILVIILNTLDNSISVSTELITKLYLIYQIIWIVSYLSYVYSYSKKNQYIANDSLYTKKVSIFSYITITLGVICSIILLTLPINLTTIDNFSYISGTGLDLSLFISLGLLLLSCIIVTINANNFRTNRYLVLLVAGIIEAFLVLISYCNSGIVDTIGETFILYLLYFLVENPELKIIDNLVIAKEQAERVSQEKSDFLTNMSHQIRTPINAIDGLSQVIEDEDNLDNIKDSAKDIRVASKNLVSLVNGILDISLLESGNIKINNVNYEVYEMFDSVVDLAKSMVINKKIDIKANIPDNIPTVLLGDSERIKQVLLNLLSNSIKFTKEGTIELKVTATVSGSLCRLKMSVKDTGIGIPKNNLHKIFNKFQKLDENTTSEGNGLGLVITQNIVDLMDGKIDVESEYGLGSVFTITIDQKVISGVTREEVLMNHSTKEVKAFDAKGKKILVVDDNRLNLKVATKLLALYNVEITECNSGQECLDILDENQDFDLILMDDMMPNMSGIETLEIIKKLERVGGFSIPVVVLTANAVTGMKEDYIARGFDDYLAKPIEKPELNRVLKKFLK